MVIFLYGDDQFRSYQKLLEIKNKYLVSDKTGSGLSVFDCEEEKEVGQKIQNVLSTPNLLAPKRLLLAKNLIAFSSSVEQKEILAFLKSHFKKISSDKDTVAVFWEGHRPKKNNAVYKFLEARLASSQKQDFKKLTGVQLEKWVMKTLAAVAPDVQLTRPALAKLVAYCGENSFLLFSEIQKLANYVSQGAIGEKEVELLVKANLNSNIFAMVDALGNNNKREALTLLHAHLESGDDPYYLLSMFAYQFHNLLKVADLKERGVFSEYEIAKVAKLHPYVAKKSLRQIGYFPLAKLKKVYAYLGRLDTLIKTGRLDIKLALDKFVAEI